MISNVLKKFVDIIVIDGLTSPDGSVGGTINPRIVKRLNADYKFIKECNNLMKDCHYTPSPKDKLFFFKKCNVPRYKVREWGKDKDISITTKSEKATVRFLNLRAHIKSHATRWSSTIASSQLLEFIELNYLTLSAEMITLVAMLKANPEALVVMPSYYNYAGASWLTGKVPYGGSLQTKGAKHNLSALGYSLKMHSIITVTAEEYAQYENMANAANVYSESEIIKHINEDSTIIDYEMVDQLNVMLDSDDRKNHVLALEIIANCNINESLYCVLLLLRQHSHTLVCLKEASHINFKSLLKFLDLSDWRRISFDDIMDNLMDKEVLKIEDVKDILERVKMEVVKHTSLFNKNFTINTLTVSDKVKAYFNPTVEVEEPIENI